jgi:hypothetical protein
VGVTGLQAVGFFVGIPALLALIIYLLVNAPSWIRDARGDDLDEGGPLLLVSARPVPDPSRLVDEMAPLDSTKAGGVSARW